MSHSESNREPFVPAKYLVMVLISILGLTSMTLAGCGNLFTVSPPDTLARVPPSATPTSTVTHTPTPGWPPTWTPTVTFTPWPPTPTFTPTSTATPYVPAPPCPSSRVSTGPLQVDYEIKGRWCPGRADYVADIVVSAKGGDGCYTYYRDIDKIVGPTRLRSVPYQVYWARCGGAPGTFFVKSRDGQEAKVLFWVYPPSCCE